MRLTLTILIVALFTAGPAAGQAVTPISSIQASPAAFRDTILTIEGYVTKHDTLEATGEFLYYVKGGKGTTLAVRTSGRAPRIGQRFVITGPLAETDQDGPYLVERARSRLSGLEDADRRGGAEIDDKGPYRALIYILGGAIVLVFLGLIGVLVYIRRDEESAGSDPANGSTERSDHSVQDAANRVIENDTLKMHVPPEHGWSVLPGRLVVKSGLEEVSEIRFYASDGQRASPITFGRADGSTLEHVQLKTSSVSNWQAKVVYDADEDRCRLVNYAVERAKPTRVNGRPLEESESVELSEGDTLEMGGIEFEFTSG